MSTMSDWLFEDNLGTLTEALVNECFEGTSKIQSTKEYDTRIQSRLAWLRTNSASTSTSLLVYWIALQPNISQDYLCNVVDT